MTSFYALWRKYGGVMLLLPCIVFMLVFFAIPVFKILMLSAFDQNGAPSMANLKRIVDSSLYFSILWGTFKISLQTTAVSLLCGYPMAYWLARSQSARRNRYVLWIVIPFWTSDLVKTFSWVILLGRNGGLNQLLQLSGVINEPLPLLHSHFAVIMGMSHALTPLATLTMLSVMVSIDTTLVRAATTLGAPPAQAFWRIFFPLSLPGVAAAGLLVFITALGFFVVPALLGNVRHTMLAQLVITQMLEVMNWGMAGALSLLLIVAAFLVFWLYDKVLGISSLAGEKAQANGPSHPVHRWLRARGNDLTAAVAAFFTVLGVGWEKVAGPRVNHVLCSGYAVLLCLFLMLPTLVVFPMAFTSADYLDFPPPGLSLKWFAAYADSDVWGGATMRSFAVGLCAASLAVVLGSLAAFGLTRLKAGRYKGLIFAFLISPLIVPRIAIAVSMFYLFAQIGLVGTSLALVLGHCVIALPFVVVTMSASLKSYDQRLSDAAATLGASPLRSFVRITLPVVKGSVIAAFLFAFITSFDDLSIALFTSGGVVTTLPKQMWDDMTLQLNPTIAAAACIVTVITISMLLIAGLARGKAGNSANPV